MRILTSFCIAWMLPIPRSPSVILILIPNPIIIIIIIRYGHVYEAFRLAISDPDSIFNEENTPGLSADLRASMLDNIAKKLTPTAVKIRADIEVTCFQGLRISSRGRCGSRVGRVRIR